jgi:hypothetical protein
MAGSRSQGAYGEAETQYNAYLALSNFDGGFGGQLNYYILGSLFGAGTKKRAAQTDIWKEQHGQANTGLCELAGICNSTAHLC